MSTIQIVSRFDGTKVLFECEVTKDQQDSGVAMRHALEKAAGARANLRGADLYGANLRGANLGGKKLAGARPLIQIGPIGSRSDYLQAFVTDRGLMIRAGCFFDTRDRFELRIVETHGDNEHAQEYRAALALIDAHAKLWPADAVDAAKMEAAEVAA